MKPSISEISGFILACAFGFMLISLPVLAGINLYRCATKGDKGELHKPEPVKPDVAPKTGLHLHKWYRPTDNLDWSHATMKWSPSMAAGSHVRKGTPLYVVARHGDVAVCQGAKFGQILVPDHCAKWFAPAENKMDGIGDMPKDEPKEKQIVQR